MPIYENGRIGSAGRSRSVVRAVTGRSIPCAARATARLDGCCAMSMNEAETCRQFVVRMVHAAGWDDDLHCNRQFIEI
jgi:hypothetical protein